MIERQQMDVDIVCVGFGPAAGGFLTKLSAGLMNEDGTPIAESQAMPGMPPQVICYERADDIGYGVSGVVTRARGIRDSVQDFDPAQIPMAAPIARERVLYLLDPHGASRRPWTQRAADAVIDSFGILLGVKDKAFELPWIPPFLQKHGGMVCSIGQLNQWAGAQVMGSGMAQIWPSTPVEKALVEDGKVSGVQLCDQGVDKQGVPDVCFMPGMNVKAQLTVVADGPIGAVGQQLDETLGLPEGKHQREWAVGMKFVVDLPEDHGLETGTVIHTIGYPEPEIFGFMYVLPDNVASLGIFVPSWFDNPVRTTYRYLQHWMQHPALWKYLKGGKLRSWGAKSLQESGRQGEPHLAGDGFVRIGEGSGSTNVLTGSGVDEAWTTGTQLAESVLELLKAGKPFTKDNLESTYVAKRRASWVEKEAHEAEHARDGFGSGFARGMIGMGLSGLTGGKINMPGASKAPWKRIPKPENYYAGRISPEELERIQTEATAQGRSQHDAIMDKLGWPAIEFDGELLVSHQDALIMGGKVQAAAGYADHVKFLYPELCDRCGTQVCVEVCSGQAISTNPEGGLPLFDREKCVHCGACLWNCSQTTGKDSERGNIRFRAGAGGLHSAEN